MLMLYQVDAEAPNANGWDGAAGYQDSAECDGLGPSANNIEELPHSTVVTTLESEVRQHMEIMDMLEQMMTHMAKEFSSILLLLRQTRYNY